MTGREPGKSSSLGVMRRIMAYLRPYAWQYAGAIAGIGLANLLINVVMARLLMDLTRGIIDSSGDMVASVTRNMTVMAVVLVTWVFFSVVPLLRAVASFQNDIRAAIFRKFTGAPLHEIEGRHSGDLLSRSNLGLRQVSSMFMGDIQLLINSLLPGVGCGIYMLMLDMRMGIAGILCGAVQLLVNLPLTRPLRDTGREVQERHSAFTERMSDIMRGGDTVRHLNLAGFAAARAGVASDDLKSAYRKQVGLESLRQLLDGAPSLASVAFGACISYLAIRDPALMPAAIAMGQLASSVRFLFDNIARVMANIQTNVGGAERILEVLDIPDEPPSISPSVPTAPGAPGDALEVSRLAFRYPGAPEDAIRDASFSAPPGRRVALVGPSGGGKSTLVKLILGLYAPHDGDVRASGKSIYGTLLHEWRNTFSYVPQEPFLFAGTVYENIVVGMRDPGQERVEHVARLANAHDFIVAMQGGYRAAITERGMNLSGGQRQRIAIARAILKDAPVLLLDEATSSLDAESEALVQEALDRLMAGRTTVVVAHRLSTVREAGEILYVDGGRILERGSHEELMERGGLYRALVEEGVGIRETAKEVAT